MTKFTTLNIFGLAKLQAFLGAHVGLLAGVIYSFGGLIYDLFTIGLNLGTLLAFGALVGMPIIFAVIGFVLGVLEAILFNILSGWTGGTEIDLGR